MKFTPNTVSQPVQGKEAKRLTKAINTNSHVANRKALATMNRIATAKGFAESFYEKYGKAMSELAKDD